MGSFPRDFVLGDGEKGVFWKILCQENFICL